MDQKYVGKIIYKRRRKLKMSQKDLAELLDVDVKCISKWEKGKCLPFYEKLESLSDILGISVKYLTDNKYVKENYMCLNSYYLLILVSILILFTYQSYLFYINVFFAFVFGIISLTRIFKSLYNN